MTTWKQINEVGGAIISRTVTGAIAALMVYGLVKVAWGGTLTLRSAGILVAGIVLFGGYTVFGNRLKTRWE